LSAGRPSDYTEEIAAQICERIAAGESLSKICTDEEMPCRTAVYNWLDKSKEFADNYARAVEDRAESLAEEILTIADDDSGDYGFKKVRNETGESAEVFIEKDNIQRARLRVDSRKWIASKLFPKKYGDKVQNEVSGADGKPIEFAVSIKLVRPNGPASA
jgi:hypothetical protein